MATEFIVDEFIVDGDCYGLISPINELSSMLHSETEFMGFSCGFAMCY